MQVDRFDIGTLTSVEKTPQGGLRVKANLTRSGVMAFQNPDGSVVREWRPPDEVFADATVKSLDDAPLTVGHRGMVNPGNYDRLSTGHIREARRDGDFVSGTIAVQGKAAITAIENGQREVSCGFHCVVDKTPGVTPEGERYDQVLRSITHNHVAIVPKGRAGHTVRMRLDSAENQIIEEESMDKIERIDGVEHVIDTPAHKDAVARHDAAVKAQKVALETATARADAAEVNLAKVKAELAVASDPKRVEGLVAERSALIGRASAVLGKEAKFDGLTPREIRELALKKVAPTTKTEGRGDEAVEVLFDALCTEQHAAKVREDGAANQGVGAALFAAAKTERMDISALARQEQLSASSNAWKGEEE